MERTCEQHLQELHDKVISQGLTMVSAAATSLGRPAGAGAGTLQQHRICRLPTLAIPSYQPLRAYQLKGRRRDAPV
jgi:hypothetical protein